MAAFELWKHKGNSDHKTEHMPKEVKKRLVEAEKGDSRAQYDIGVVYQEGRGVPQNYEEAAKWFRRSAEQDDFAAFCIRVLLYDVGLEKSDDHEEIAKRFREAAEAGLGPEFSSEPPGRTSIRWLKLSAEHGNVGSQRNLGFAYQEGMDGVPQDYEESAKWIRLAAENGDTMAQSNLSFLYKNGLGVPLDYEEAAKWYALAEQELKAQKDIFNEFCNFDTEK
ncbi:MAG: sel1 repeat family protein [Methanomassiliicoccaceae archaeon]|nr:sel1 repeat family protein [Methanomassiliicoccaceae archaeon]